jgi:hypothetical protein
MSKLNKVIKSIPKSVRVGCFDFEIKIMHLDESNLSGAIGVTHLIKNRIGIRVNDQTSQQIANTFIHEVLHAIHWGYGLNDNSNEELFTELTANGLCQFWQDNPLACVWWRNAVALGGEK